MCSHLQLLSNVTWVCTENGISDICPLSACGFSYHPGNSLPESTPGFSSLEAHSPSDLPGIGRGPSPRRKRVLCWSLCWLGLLTCWMLLIVSLYLLHLMWNKHEFWVLLLLHLNKWRIIHIVIKTDEFYHNYVYVVGWLKLIDAAILKRGRIFLKYRILRYFVILGEMRIYLWIANYLHTSCSQGMCAVISIPNIQYTHKCASLFNHHI